MKLAYDYDNETPQLKPCPFCGGVPELYHLLDDGLEAYHVYCPVAAGCGVHHRSFRDKQKAVDVWNKRITS